MVGSPSFRQLRIFVAVAEHLSFTSAARAIGISQQSVSKAVAGLEQELDVQLLQRSTREVRLTPAGKLLATRGGYALEMADMTFDDVKRIGSGRAGVFRIGVTSDIGVIDRTDVIQALLESPGDTAVEIVELRHDEWRDALLVSQIDLALTASAHSADPELHHADLRPTAMAIYAPVGRAAAPRGELADFTGNRLLICKPQGTAYTDRQLATFAQARVTVTPVEGRVDGGMAQALMQLETLDAISLLPVGTPTPPNVKSTAVVECFPLEMHWSARRDPPAATHLRRALATPA